MANQVTPCPPSLHHAGWITLQAETSRCLQPQAQAAQRKPTYATDPDWDAYHEYYQHFDPARGYTGSTLPVIGNKQRKLERVRAGIQVSSQEHGLLSAKII